MIHCLNYVTALIANGLLLRLATLKALFPMKIMAFLPGFFVPEPTLLPIKIKALYVLYVEDSVSSTAADVNRNIIAVGNTNKYIGKNIISMSAVR